MKKFLVNGIILTCTSLVLRAIGMFFSVYISNKIGSESIGIFSLVMSVYLFFVTFALSGINLGCIRLVSEELAYGNNHTLKMVIKKCLFFSLAFGMASFVTLFIFAPYISSTFLHNKISCMPLYIIALSLPFVAMSSCINGYFTALSQIKKTAFVEIIEQVLKIVIICILFKILNPESVDLAIISLVLGTTISEVGSFILLYVFYKLSQRKMKENRSKSQNTFAKQILRISIPVAITSYIRSGLSTAKHLLIPVRLEKYGLSCSDALSQYGIINGMVFPLILFPNILILAFSELLIPEFSYNNAKSDLNKMNRMLNLIFKYSFIFSFGIVGVFMCFSDSFSVLIYNNIAISKYVKILCPLVVLMYIDGVVDSILKGLDKQVTVMGINILDLVTCISLIYFLLPIYGMNGYLLVIFVSEILNFTLSFIKLLKTTNLKVNYTNWIIFPCISIVITYLISKKFINTFVILIPNLIINILIFAFIYVSILYLFNFIFKQQPASKNKHIFFYKQK